MMPQKDREMTLFDGMVLVGAAAVGFRLVGMSQVRAVLEQGYYLKAYYNYGVAFGYLVYPVWLCWTFAALAIRLRSPRPRFRRLARQPGFVATFSVSIGALISLALFLLRANKIGSGPGNPIPTMYFLRLPFDLFWLIFGAWLAQILNRKWRSEASAIDRFGRLLGFGWIAFFLFEAFWSFLYYP
jgi:hypothetical protein